MSEGPTAVSSNVCEFLGPSQPYPSPSAPSLRSRQDFLSLSWVETLHSSCSASSRIRNLDWAALVLVTLSSFVSPPGTLHRHFRGFLQVTEQAWEGIRRGGKRRQQGRALTGLTCQSALGVELTQLLPLLFLEHGPLQLPPSSLWFPGGCPALTSPAPLPTVDGPRHDFGPAEASGQSLTKVEDVKAKD